MSGVNMSSAITSELNKPTGRFVVTRERIEKATNGFLESERRVPETIICESLEEADAYKATSDPSVAVEIHDLDEVDENGVSLYLHDLLSRPEQDSEAYMRSRLDWINVRLVTLGHFGLETPIHVYPDGRYEKSNGRSLPPRCSKWLMYAYLIATANPDDEAYQLAVVGELGICARNSSDQLLSMQFMEQMGMLRANFQYGNIFTFGLEAKSRAHRGGKTTGGKQKEGLNGRIELVRKLLLRPGISNCDPATELENVKREIIAHNITDLLNKDGGFRLDDTILRWISNAHHRNRMDALAGTSNSKK